MRVKKGADISTLSEEIIKIFPILEEICSIYQIEFVITAGSDGKHMKNSKHYSKPFCEAIDIRTRDLKELDRDEFAESIRGRFEDDYPDEFDFLLHLSHLHIEYDPHK